MFHINWCTVQTMFDANEEGGQIDDMVSASGGRAALSSVSVLPIGVFLPPDSRDCELEGGPWRSA